MKLQESAGITDVSLRMLCVWWGGDGAQLVAVGKSLRWEGAAPWREVITELEWRELVEVLVMVSPGGRRLVFP